MLAVLLLLAGAGLSGYCLWQLRQWMPAAERPGEGSARLERIVDELVATAELTAQVVDEKAQGLTVLIAQADEKLALLQAAAKPKEAPAPAVQAVHPPVQPPVQPQVPELHRQIYRLSDEGQDLTAIARTLSITKGEVQLILGMRRPS